MNAFNTTLCFLFDVFITFIGSDDAPFPLLDTNQWHQWNILLSLQHIFNNSLLT